MKLYKFTYSAMIAAPSYVEMKDYKHLGLKLSKTLQDICDNTFVIDGHKTIVEIIDEITIS